MKEIQKFINYLESKNSSKDTIKTYRFNLTKWFELTGKDVKSVTIEDLQDYIELLRNDNKSSATIAVIVSTLKSFFGFLGLDTAKELRIPKIEKKLPKYLTEKECVALLEKVDKKAIKNPKKEYAMRSCCRSSKS